MMRLDIFKELTDVLFILYLSLFGCFENCMMFCNCQGLLLTRGTNVKRGCVLVKRTSGGGDPNSLGANRAAYYPRYQSLFVHSASDTR